MDDNNYIKGARDFLGDLSENESPDDILDGMSDDHPALSNPFAERQARGSDLRRVSAVPRSIPAAALSQFSYGSGPIKRRSPQANPFTNPMDAQMEWYGRVQEGNGVSENSVRQSRSLRSVLEDSIGLKEETRMVPNPLKRGSWSNSSIPSTIPQRYYTANKGYSVEETRDIWDHPVVRITRETAEKVRTQYDISHTNGTFTFAQADRDVKYALTPVIGVQMQGEGKDRKPTKLRYQAPANTLASLLHNPSPGKYNDIMFGDDVASKRDGWTSGPMTALPVEDMMSTANLLYRDSNTISIPAALANGKKMTDKFISRVTGFINGIRAENPLPTDGRLDETDLIRGPKSSALQSVSRLARGSLISVDGEGTYTGSKGYKHMRLTRGMRGGGGNYLVDAQTGEVRPRLQSLGAGFDENGPREGNLTRTQFVASRLPFAEGGGYAKDGALLIATPKQEISKVSSYGPDFTPGTTYAKGGGVPTVMPEDGKLVQNAQSVGPTKIPLGGLGFTVTNVSKDKRTGRMRAMGIQWDEFERAEFKFSGTKAINVPLRKNASIFRDDFDPDMVTPLPDTGTRVRTLFRDLFQQQAASDPSETTRTTRTRSMVNQFLSAGQEVGAKDANQHIILKGKDGQAYHGDFGSDSFWDQASPIIEDGGYIKFADTQESRDAQIYAETKYFQSNLKDKTFKGVSMNSNEFAGMLFGHGVGNEKIAGINQPMDAKKTQELTRRAGARWLFENKNIKNVFYQEYGSDERKKVKRFEDIDFANELDDSKGVYSFDLTEKVFDAHLAAAFIKTSTQGKRSAGTEFSSLMQNNHPGVAPILNETIERYQAGNKSLQMINFARRMTDSKDKFADAVNVEDLDYKAAVESAEKQWTGMDMDEVKADSQLWKRHQTSILQALAKQSDNKPIRIDDDTVVSPLKFAAGFMDKVGRDEFGGKVQGRSYGEMVLQSIQDKFIPAANKDLDGMTPAGESLRAEMASELGDIYISKEVMVSASEPKLSALSGPAAGHRALPESMVIVDRSTYRKQLRANGVSKNDIEKQMKALADGDARGVANLDPQSNFMMANPVVQVRDIGWARKNIPGMKDAVVPKNGMLMSTSIAAAQAKDFDGDTFGLIALNLTRQELPKTSNVRFDAEKNRGTEAQSDRNKLGINGDMYLRMSTTDLMAHKGETVHIDKLIKGGAEGSSNKSDMGMAFDSSVRPTRDVVQLLSQKLGTRMPSQLISAAANFAQDPYQLAMDQSPSKDAASNDLMNAMISGTSLKGNSAKYTMPFQESPALFLSPSDAQLREQMKRTKGDKNAMLRNLWNHDNDEAHLEAENQYARGVLLSSIRSGQRVSDDPKESSDRYFGSGMNFADASMTDVPGLINDHARMLVPIKEAGNESMVGKMRDFLHTAYNNTGSDDDLLRGYYGAIGQNVSSEGHLRSLVRNSVMGKDYKQTAISDGTARKNYEEEVQNRPLLPLVINSKLSAQALVNNKYGAFFGELGYIKNELDENKNPIPNADGEIGTQTPSYAEYRMPGASYLDAENFGNTLIDRKTVVDAVKNRVKTDGAGRETGGAGNWANMGKAIRGLGDSKVFGAVGAIFGPLMNSMAGGGKPKKGELTVVGENGPELIDGNGNVLPNSEYNKVMSVPGNIFALRKSNGMKSSLGSMAGGGNLDHPDMGPRKSTDDVPPEDYDLSEYVEELGPRRPTGGNMPGVIPNPVDDGSWKHISSQMTARGYGDDQIGAVKSMYDRNALPQPFAVAPPNKTPAGYAVVPSINEDNMNPNVYRGLFGPNPNPVLSLGARVSSDFTPFQELSATAEVPGQVGESQLVDHVLQSWVNNGETGQRDNSYIEARKNFKSGNVAKRNARDYGSGQRPFIARPRPQGNPGGVTGAGGGNGSGGGVPPVMFTDPGDSMRQATIQAYTTKLLADQGPVVRSFNSIADTSEYLAQELGFGSVNDLMTATPETLNEFRRAVQQHTSENTSTPNIEATTKPFYQARSTMKTAQALFALTGGESGGSLALDDLNASMPAIEGVVKNPVFNAVAGAMSSVSRGREFIAQQNILADPMYSGARRAAINGINGVSPDLFDRAMKDVGGTEDFGKSKGMSIMGQAFANVKKFSDLNPAMYENSGFTQKQLSEGWEAMQLGKARGVEGAKVNVGAEVPTDFSQIKALEQNISKVNGVFEKLGTTTEMLTSQKKDYARNIDFVSKSFTNVGKTLDAITEKEEVWGKTLSAAEKAFKASFDPANNPALSAARQDFLKNKGAIEADQDLLAADKGLNSGQSDAYYSARANEMLMEPGLRGRKGRESEEFKDLLEQGHLRIGDREIKSAGTAEALGAGMRFSANIGRAMFGLTMMQHNLVNPMMQSATAYNDSQLRSGEAVMKTGAISMSDLRGSSMNNARRNFSNSEQFNLGYGESVANAYGGLLGNGSNIAGKAAGSAVSIAAPGIGAAMMVGAFSPMLAAPAAAIGFGAGFLGNIASRKGNVSSYADAFYEGTKQNRSLGDNVSLGFERTMNWFAGPGNDEASWQGKFIGSLQANYADTFRTGSDRSSVYSNTYEGARRDVYESDWRKRESDPGVSLDANREASDRDLSGRLASIPRIERDLAEFNAFKKVLAEDGSYGDEASNSLWSGYKAHALTMPAVEYADSMSTASSRGLDPQAMQSSVFSAFGSNPYSADGNLAYRSLVAASSAPFMNAAGSSSLVSSLSRDLDLASSRYQNDLRNQGGPGSLVVKANPLGVIAGTMNSFNISSGLFTGDSFGNLPEEQRSFASDLTKAIESWTQNMKEIVGPGFSDGGYTQRLTGVVSQGNFTAGTNFLARSGQVGSWINQQRLGNYGDFDAAGSSMAAFNMLGAPQGMQNMLSGAMSGDMTALTALSKTPTGAAAGLNVNAIDLQTGQSPYARQITMREYTTLSRNAAKGGVPAGQMPSFADVKDGTVAMEYAQRNEQYGYQKDGFGIQAAQARMGFAFMTGGTRQLDAQGFAVGGDIAAAVGRKNFNPGNGMGQWQVQDRMTQISREKQDWQMEQQGIDLDFSGRNNEMQIRQFNEKWNASWAWNKKTTQHNRLEMQIGRSQSLVQRGWQQTDMALNQNMADVQFGWQNEDNDRNLRYARGRDRIDLMRQQTRQNVMFNLQQTGRDNDKSRFAETNKWADERYNRDKKFFEDSAKHQKDEMKMEKRHFMERMAMSQEQLERAKQNYEKEKKWLLEQRGLEDQSRLLERQQAMYMYDFQQASIGLSMKAAESAKQFADDMKALEIGDEVTKGVAQLNLQFGQTNKIIVDITSNVTKLVTEWNKLKASQTPHNFSGDVDPKNSVGSDAGVKELLKKILKELKDISDMGPGRVNATIYTSDSEVKTKDLVSEAYKVTRKTR